MPKLSAMRRSPTRRRAAAALLLSAVAALAGAGASSADDVSSFDGTWLDRALRLQYELGSDVGFEDAPLVGTHNSFNSAAELGSGLPAPKTNQRLDLTDQLDVGVRSLELDLHREPNGDGTDDRPIVCHTFPQEGCTVVKDIDPLVGEIADWLQRPDNSDQVLLLYLEDDLDTLGLHDSAASIIAGDLGDLLYEPPERGCNEIPSDLTRDDVREAGKQVVIVSGCGKGVAWHSLAFSWESHLEARPHGFEDFPSCGPDYAKSQYRASLIRYYEDSTRTAATSGTDDGLTPETAAAMARCGVDLFGFDQLEPFDGRLEGAVWSWATDEPSSGRCAVIRTGKRLQYGRWVSAPCDELLAPPVCRDGRKWSVGAKRLDPAVAGRFCRRHGSQPAVPRTGYENQLVRLAMEERGTHSALLGYRERGGEWVPLDVRGPR